MDYKIKYLNRKEELEKDIYSRLIEYLEIIDFDMLNRHVSHEKNICNRPVINDISIKYQVNNESIGSFSIILAPQIEIGLLFKHIIIKYVRKLTLSLEIYNVRGLVFKMYINYTTGLVEYNMSGMEEDDYNIIYSILSYTLPNMINLFLNDIDKMAYYRGHHFYRMFINQLMFLNTELLEADKRLMGITKEDNLVSLYDGLTYKENFKPKTNDILDRIMKNFKPSTFCIADLETQLIENEKSYFTLTKEFEMGDDEFKTTVFTGNRQFTLDINLKNVNIAGLYYMNIRRHYDWKEDSKEDTLSFKFGSFDSNTGVISVTSNLDTSEVNIEYSQYIRSMVNIDPVANSLEKAILSSIQVLNYGDFQNFLMEVHDGLSDNSDEYIDEYDNDSINYCDYYSEEEEEKMIEQYKNDMYLDSKLDKEYFQVLKDISDAYIRKNNDYGSSATNTFDKYGLVSYLTRISDKMNRLDNLIINSVSRKVDDETIEDTLLDLAGYAILALRDYRKNK